MPIFWSEEELSWLEGSYLLKQVEDRLHNIKEDYDEIAAVRDHTHTHPHTHTCTCVCSALPACFACVCAGSDPSCDH